MIVMPVIDSRIAPTMGSFMGGGSQAVIDRLNDSFSQSAGVIFGDPSAISERYSAFCNTVLKMDNEATLQISAVARATFNPNRIIAITTEDELDSAPVCMHLPILTIPRVRDLYEKGLVMGWGIKPETLPDDDCYGRMLNNGTFTWEQGAPEGEQLVEYTTKSGDPDLSIEELILIGETREFVDTWLDEELSKDGRRRDISDMSRRMRKIR